MHEINIFSKAKLNNGVEIPYLGLGTFQITGKKVYEAISYALEIGYRHFDSAKFYQNEKEVGEVIREAIDKGLVSREEIFITTKLWNDDHGYKPTAQAFHQSLNDLGLEYIDLYLIHWPASGLRYESWKAMEKIVEEGQCRAIGVSNYTIRHLEELLEKASMVPVINQVEFSPYLYQKNLLEYCNSKSIMLESYAPLTRGEKLTDSKLVKVATKYSKSPAQILIRWCLEHGIVVIPKSEKKLRIQENANVFDFSISIEDMAELDSLNENLRLMPDPSFLE